MKNEIAIGPDAVELIARRVVELLREEEGTSRSARLVDAAALAAELGVDRDWVYSHADELGAIRLGGPNGRLRFDLEIVRGALEGDSMSRAGRVPATRRRFAGTTSRNSAPNRRVKSPKTQRRASGRAPARSPKRQHPGGSPEC